MIRFPHLALKSFLKTKTAILFAGCLALGCTQPQKKAEFTYPNGLSKALVLSYDDGPIQDVKLAQLFDAHRLVGTFNLNSGYLGTVKGWPLENGDTVYQRYVPRDSLIQIFGNHEVAAHGEFHQNFLDIDHDAVRAELQADLDVLPALIGKPVVSMAYPFGACNKAIAELATEVGLLNGRTINDTHGFELPTDFMLWDPTTHDSRALEHADDYLALDQPSLSLFYVWGHAWELDDEARWNNMRTFCEKMGKAEDIWFVGHGTLTQYLLALDRVEQTEQGLYNPKDNPTVWIRSSQQVVAVAPGTSVSY